MISVVKFWSPPPIVERVGYTPWRNSCAKARMHHIKMLTNDQLTDSKYNNKETRSLKCDQKIVMGTPTESKPHSVPRPSCRTRRPHDYDLWGTDISSHTSPFRQVVLGKTQTVQMLISSPEWGWLDNCNVSVSGSWACKMAQSISNLAQPRSHYENE